MLKFIKLFVFLVTAFFYGYYSISIKAQRTESIALDSLNLEMSGVVWKIENLNGFNGTGIIDVRIIKSNIKEYDPRNNIKYYYCLITLLL